ncbi:hypothetical protein BDQ94DRAFT_137233 [Aspergillus welwitschiae]|uniref:Uncharacterized protein n=1 Tax=Aspergillus welwitschiae TaxID=1341132 RepID=A0A3F3QCR0_9EURO|nr:hypothetical protein BDQ94DRAFT_137233 [Aspergillus welwitschiae]RDH36983.1 hypothetical protein BDQ94DRAFT_137233 [Aspergillus welwitschiae]
MHSILLRLGFHACSESKAIPRISTQPMRVSGSTGRRRLVEKLSHANGLATNQSGGVRHRRNRTSRLVSSILPDGHLFRASFLCLSYTSILCTAYLLLFLSHQGLNRRRHGQPDS